MTTMYVSAENIKKDKAVAAKVLKAQFTDDDIESRINEAIAYIEGRLIKMGFTRERLIAAPDNPVPLVIILIKNYTFYCILRDIYTQTAPSESTGEPYEKWRDNVEKILEMLEANSIKLLDENGNIIEPTGNIDLRPQITTMGTKRMMTLGDSTTWKIDGTNYSKDVTGEK